MSTTADAADVGGGRDARGARCKNAVEHPSDPDARHNDRRAGGFEEVARDRRVALERERDLDEHPDRCAGADREHNPVASQRGEHERDPGSREYRPVAEVMKARQRPGDLVPREPVHGVLREVGGGQRRVARQQREREPHRADTHDPRDDQRAHLGHANPPPDRVEAKDRPRLGAPQRCEPQARERQPVAAG